MMFDSAYQRTRQFEGGYSNNPRDRGGATINGISSKYWPQDFNTVQNLVQQGKKQEAENYTKDFYKKNFWEPIGGDQLKPEIAPLVFDAAVNHGVDRAKMILASSGDNPNKFLDQRQGYVDKIVQNDPSQGEFQEGWSNRINNQRRQPVTDPSILSQLETPQRTPVNDPGLLAQLEGSEQEAPKEPGVMKSVITGALDPVYGVSQFAPRALSKITSLGGIAPNPVSRAYDRNAHNNDEIVKTREENYGDTQGVDWGRMAGNVASPANFLGPAGAVGKATSFGGRLLAGIGSGIATGLEQPVADIENYAKEKTKQVGFGALGGGIAPTIGAGIERVFNPRTEASVKKLLDEGLKLTPGEMAGGIVKRGEDLLSSVPGVGSLIKGAQKRSIESLNKTAINRALAPLGKELPKNIDLGRDAIGYVNETLGQAYDDLLPKLNGKVDQKFTQDLSDIADMVDQDFIMSDASKSQFKNIMDKLVHNRLSQNGSITGQAVKDIESNLGSLSSKLGKSLDPSDSQLADALGEVRTTLRGMLERNNPQHAEQLKAINKGYANFKRVQRASASVGSDEGVFTPAQLQSAVKALDRSKDKSAFAKGSALMQDLTDPAKSKMAPSVPNSGTTDRALAAATMFGLGGGMKLTPMAIPAALMATGYVPGGRRVMQTLLAGERPDTLKKLGSAAAKYAPYLGAPLAAPLANQ